MPQQVINLGATGSGAGGDSARTAFEKIIANFGELYPAALPGTAAQKQAARDVFGLGTAATKAAQTGPTDTTAGALMAVGAFGLGSKAVTAAVDFNELPTLYPYTGFVPVLTNNLSANAPGSNSYFYVQQMFWSGGTNVCQIAYPYRMDSDGFWMRTLFNGSWSAWRRMYHTGNILGTVSQAGGVPTGAIIERGSNANGEYVRFADGTQIARFASADITSVDVASGSLYISSSVIGWNYPAPFADIPSVSVNARYISGPNTAAWAQGNTATASQAVSRVASGVPIAACQFKILFTAIGRWY